MTTSEWYKLRRSMALRDMKKYIPVHLTPTMLRKLDRLRLSSREEAKEIALDFCLQVIEKIEK